MADHPLLLALPSDEIRNQMWGLAERFDLQLAAQAARSVARGTVARLVAAGERQTHAWTPGKQSLIEAFDEAQISNIFFEPANGGLIEGPKNMALALSTFELAWVDAGAATCAMAGNLALSPINEKGTPAQKTKYMSTHAKTKEGQPWRGAFALTEPLPYVGVDASLMAGTMEVVGTINLPDGPSENIAPEQMPRLKVRKRGRFITGMAFANFVSAAVEASGEGIKGSSMVILEEGDPGTFDRGTPTHKLVHQLSSTRDPNFVLEVPADRLIGGFDLKDNVIIPRFSHSEIIEAVFRRTRVTVGIMSAAKVLSAVEPIIQYQRQRFRGGHLAAGTPRYEQGLQQKEDCVQRLAKIAAIGEAAASLGFATAQKFDEFEPIEQAKEAYCKAKGIKGRMLLRATKQHTPTVLAYLESHDQNLLATEDKPFLEFLMHDALLQVLCPAVKLWNPMMGEKAMREAVLLMGGYGITEDSPGFLMQKWIDTQLEATYEGPEAVQRRQLSVTMASPIFLKQLELWANDFQKQSTEASYKDLGLNIIAHASKVWLQAINYTQKHQDAQGALYHSQRQGISFALADALTWIMASRYQALGVMRLIAHANDLPHLAEALPGTISYLSNLCQWQALRMAGEVLRITEEIILGTQAADDDQADRQAFIQSTTDLRGQLTGARAALTRAGEHLTAVTVAAALDYPQT
jgi:alkylation response protein AidB-like acyl-CoA dehydrogenase